MHTDIAQNLPKQIRQAKKDFWTSHVHEIVLTELDAYEFTWLHKANKLCARWSRYNSSGFLAFLKHEGSWKTTRCPQADWNQDLLDVMEEHLRTAFDTLCDKSSNILQEELVDISSDQLDGMRNSLKASLDTNQLSAFAEFFENIRRHEKEIEIALKHTCKAFGVELP